MSKTYRQLLIIPHLKIQNANALSSPYTIGFPAMTAWLGALHALQRKLNADVLSEVTLDAVAVISHDFDLQTYRGPGDFVNSIVGTGNPLVEKKKRKKDEPWELFERPAFIEEARCHLEVSLIIELSGITADDEDELLQAIDRILRSNHKIAGGDILNLNDPFYTKVKEGSTDELNSLVRNVMPGYAIIERRQLMIEAMETGQDPIEAMLDYVAVHHSCDRDESGNVVWSSKRKTSGWIVPIATGFHGITELGTTLNQRDPDVPHRFVESVVTLGEFKMPLQIQSIDEILWRYRFDEERSLYLCQQSNY